MAMKVNPGMLAEFHPEHPGLIRVLHWDSIDAYCVECEEIHKFKLRTDAPLKNDGWSEDEHAGDEATWD